jgi:hypothetical protein
MKILEIITEGLGYSTDPEQGKWYHEGRKAFKFGTTGNTIQDIAKKHGCPPEWLKAFHAGYQDQESWGVKESKAQPSKPRNFVVKNAKMGGAGKMKDKSKTLPRHEKHKKPVAEGSGGDDTVQSLVNIRSTVKQIQTGKAQYPQGFASQLEVALYDAINALRDNPDQGAQNTVKELAGLRAIAKQVQTGKVTFPQGYTSRLEWVLYDAIKQIENSSQGKPKHVKEDDGGGATAGSTSAAMVGVGAVYKNKRAKKQKPGTNALDMKGVNLLTGGSIKR